MRARVHWSILVLPFVGLLISNYQGGLLAQYSILGVVAALLAFTWGYGGILNFFHIIAFGLGAYAVAWFTLHLDSMGSVIGLGVAIVLAGSVGLLIGLAGLGRNYQLMTFALMTFVIVMALEQIAGQLTEITGGFNGLSGIARLGLGEFRLDRSQNAFVVTLAAVGVMLVLRWLSRSPYGVALQAVRDAPRRMGSFGIDVPRVRVSAFTLTACLTGLLGGLYATQTQFVSPGDIGFALGTSILIWAMLGSRATIFGPFIATVAINFGMNELSHSIVDYWLLIMGFVFTLVVRFLPDGFGVWLLQLVPRRWRAPGRVVLEHRSPTLDAADHLPGGSRPEFVVEKLSVSYGSNRVIQEVSFTVAPGEVVCLIGPNGAGKSTVLNALSGVIPVEQGSWSLRDTHLENQAPWVIARAGVSRKYQHPSVAAELTVGENLALAVWGREKEIHELLSSQWSIPLEDAAWHVLRSSGLEKRLTKEASSLSHGQRQMLELAMALAAPCEVLLLDEPAAGMTRADAELLGELLMDISKDSGPGMVVVEHDVQLIRRIADRVVVLQDGAIIAEGTYDQIESDVRVQEAYLGSNVG